MDNSIFPLDPADDRPDYVLWSGWPARTTHLTTATEPTPAPVDMVECFCGEHVWIAADGRRWTWGNPPERHHCPPVETPLEAAEAVYEARSLDNAGRVMSDLLVEARRRYGHSETLANATLDDFVIE